MNWQFRIIGHNGYIYSPEFETPNGALKEETEATAEYISYEIEEVANVRD